MRRPGDLVEVGGEFKPQADSVRSRPAAVAAVARCSRSCRVTGALEPK